MDGLIRRFTVVGSEEEALLKVAFATDDGKRVNQHFGTAASFLIFGVTREKKTLISVAEFNDVLDHEKEDKLAAKIDYLDECVAVYCRACGASAVRQLLGKKIQPIKVIDNSQILELVKALQRELAEGPSTWLAKAIRRQRGEESDPFELEG